MPSGIPGVADFTVFPSRSVSSDIRQGVLETILKDQQLAQFLQATLSGGLYLTDGRCYALPIPYLPDRPMPFACVYNVTEKRDLQLNFEAILTTTIGISLVWNEDREVLAQGSQGCEEFFARVIFALLSDQRLENTSIGRPNGRGLADYAASIEIIDYKFWKSSSPDLVTVSRDMYIVYRTTVDAATSVAA
jgi:hypothetical protein